ncbi:RAMP superfamily CRISPR-associated protein, partial [Infirmifilum sp.]|uniref:RAMP superfamily CRISPR-associated protein n=1 Tax=Infirmifilum sp. TaxID=2856575 RepID=UPI003D141AAC
MVYAKFVGIINFVADTPFNIGGRREANRLYTLRLNDRLLIPASTWKGAFRSIAEKIARTMSLTGVEKTAVEVAASAHDVSELIGNITRSHADLLEKFKTELENREWSQFPEADKVLRELGYRDEDLASESPEWLLAQYLLYHCPIGKLFGNWVRAGSLLFTDTLIQSKLHTRPGVGIDRASGTVKEDVLYFVETSTPGLKVQLILIGDIDARASTPSTLLARTLQAIKTIGLSLGARKSAGLGALSMLSAEFHTVELGKDPEL